MARLFSWCCFGVARTVVTVGLFGTLGCVSLEKPEVVAACEKTSAGCSDDDWPSIPNVDAETSRSDVAPRDAEAAGGAGGGGIGGGASGGGGVVGGSGGAGHADARSGRDDGGDVRSGDAAMGVHLDGALVGADTRTHADAHADAPADLPFQPEVQDVGRDLADASVDLPVDTRPTNTVSISNGFGQGLMTGSGYLLLAAKQSLTTPTCGALKLPISGVTPCLGSVNWNSATALCVSAVIAALPANPSALDYATNWGLQFGVNAAEPNRPIGKAFATITFNVTGTPLADLRAELHRAGDPSELNFCALMTPGVAITLTNFNTACWNNSGLKLKAADIPTIDRVGIQANSTKTAVTVKDLCLESVVFGL